MKYCVCEDFAKCIPNFYFGAVAVSGFDNHLTFFELNEELQQNIRKCEQSFGSCKVKESSEIIPYREAFQTLGINPNKFMCSIEALLSRIAKGKGFPSINTIVDLGNCISIKYHLPVGAHDLNTINDSLDVRLAMEGDSFIPFGSSDEEKPEIGEAVYACGHEIRTRRWTWRQSERGKITEDTTSVLFPIDGFFNVNEDIIHMAVEDFSASLKKYFGNSVIIETGFVDKDHPVFEFFK